MLVRAKGIPQYGITRFGIDVIADAIRDVIRDVEVEPQLLLYDHEELLGRTANRCTEARVDIRAQGFWTRQQNAFF